MRTSCCVFAAKTNIGVIWTLWHINNMYIYKASNWSPIAVRFIALFICDIEKEDFQCYIPVVLQDNFLVVAKMHCYIGASVKSKRLETKNQMHFEKVRFWKKSMWWWCVS